MGGIEVWMRLFVQAVGFLSSLLDCLLKALKLEKIGGSSVAPVKDAVSISISKSMESPINLTNLMRVMRDPTKETADGVFGVMDYEGKYLAVTMERKSVSIPTGTFRGYKRYSSHLGIQVVGIDVPNRTDIECHPANHVCQLEGCIAVGDTIDNDALDNSKDGFDRMMAAVPDTFTVQVS